MKKTSKLGNKLIYDDFDIYLESLQLLSATRAFSQGLLVDNHCEKALICTRIYEPKNGNCFLVFLNRVLFPHEHL
jgi:hypothetical protein